MIRMCILICLFITTVLSFPKYRSEIPNGFNVTNPCPGQQGIWKGVGHFLVGGTGPNNQFGLVNIDTPHFMYGNFVNEFLLFSPKG